MKKHANFKNRVGEKYITNEGYDVIIIEYIGKNNCTIKFNDVHEAILTGIQIGNLKKGNVKNPYHPIKCGVGFIGEGGLLYKDRRKYVKVYNMWYDMMERCYSIKSQEKRPTYIDCFVVEEWHNFQNFAEWFDENYIEGFELDKDIIFKGNKLYSPKTCCFVPQEINTLFTNSRAKRGELPIGVKKHRRKYKATISKNNVKLYLGLFDTPEEAFQAYKTEKEKYIKEVADKWKGIISPKVHQAMYNYKVEITD